MRQVQFPLVETNGVITYPDDIELFSNTDVLNDTTMIGWYSGDLPLDDYTPPPVVDPVFVSKYTFRTRFTFDERLGIDSFDSNVTLTDEQKQNILTITKDFDSAQEIDLALQETIDGVNYLETAGLLTVGRAAEILDTTNI